MYAFQSMIQWHLKLYYKNRENYIGVTHLLRAYHFSKIHDMIFFGASYDNEEAKRHNRMFRAYWKAELDKRKDVALQLLSELHIELSKKLMDVYDYNNRFEKLVSDMDLNLFVQHGSWIPKMIGVEIIE